MSKTVFNDQYFYTLIKDNKKFNTFIYNGKKFILSKNIIITLNILINESDRINDGGSGPVYGDGNNKSDVILRGIDYYNDQIVRTQLFDIKDFGFSDWETFTIGYKTLNLSYKLNRIFLEEFWDRSLDNLNSKFHLKNLDVEYQDFYYQYPNEFSGYGELQLVYYKWGGGNCIHDYSYKDFSIITQLQQYFYRIGTIVYLKLRFQKTLPQFWEHNECGQIQEYYKNVYGNQVTYNQILLKG